MGSSVKPRARKNRHPEADQQRALFAWRDRYKRAYPNIGRLYSIPNSQGFMKPWTIMLLKQEGLTPGVWDVFLSVPIQPYSGMYLEAKGPRGDLSDAQASFRSINEKDYVFVMFRDWTDAAKSIATYLGIQHSAVGLQ